MAVFLEQVLLNSGTSNYEEKDKIYQEGELGGVSHANYHA